MKFLKQLIVSLVFSVLIFWGCNNGMLREYIPKVVEVSDLDLKKYSNLGFLFTPYRYDNQYNSIGIMSVKAMPEANFVDTQENYTGMKRNVKEKAWKINNLYLDEALETLYLSAKAKGADAIVDLKIESTSEQYTTTYEQQEYPVTVYGYKISGFAIKRLELNK